MQGDDSAGASRAIPFRITCRKIIPGKCECMTHAYTRQLREKQHEESNKGRGAKQMEKGIKPKRNMLLRRRAESREDLIDVCWYRHSHVQLILQDRDGTKMNFRLKTSRDYKLKQVEQPYSQLVGQ